MNQYVRELKKIVENYENFQQNEDLKQQLYALYSLIDHDLKDDEKLPIKAADVVGTIITKFFNPATINDAIKTGFPQIDRTIVGFQKGEFIVIGGRPGMGKTQLMVQLATNIAEQKVAIAYFSLEFNTEILTQKLLANLAQVSPETFARPGEYNNQIEEKLSFAIKQLKEMPIYFYENPSTHINKLIKLITNLVSEKNVKVVFIDYLQLISIGSRRINRDVEMSIICRELKRLAKELEITLIVGSQLSRQVENRPGGSRRPQLSDLRESGSIEQDADKVFLLYRPEYYGLEIDENNQTTINKMEIMLSKNRSGPLWDFSVKALFSKSIIVDIEDYEDKRYIKSSEINISSDRLKDFDNPTNNTNDVF